MNTLDTSQKKVFYTACTPGDPKESGMRMLISRLAAAMLAVAIAFVPTVRSGGAADAGRDYYNKRCAQCHALSPDINHYGPNLHCLIGRGAASSPFRAYTSDMKAVSAAGLVWDAENVSAFLVDPVAFTRTYLGKPDAVILMQVTVPTEADRYNLIAYIQSRCR